MYRLAVEKILGLQREGNRLTIKPCIPTAWQDVEIHYRFGAATYHIHVENPQTANDSGIRLTLDDVPLNHKYVRHWCVKN